jgi:hypothetical protein
VEGDSLVQEIGRQSEALWEQRLPSRFQGRQHPFIERAPPWWSLSYRLVTRLDALGEPVWLWVVTLVVIVPLVVLDLVHALVRLVLWPIVLVLWWLEKRWALWRGWYYFCPFCHHRMEDPWVYCDQPKCHRRVQPSLRPQYNSLFIRRCCSCARSRWAVLGQRLLFPPRTLVCRHTPTTSGCHRILGVPDLAGRLAVHHVALAGTSLRARHALMAHLFDQLTDPDERGRAWEPAWTISALEMQLCREVLCRAFEQDTEFCERPGERYSLAWTFLLRAGRRGLCFHHLLGAWFDRTESLAENGTNQEALHGLILCLDPDDLVAGVPPGNLPPEEIYARLVRVAEEYLALAPGQRLPWRVALVVGVTERQEALSDLYEAGPGGAGEKEVEAVLRHYVPGLLALVQRTVGRGRVRCFAGPIPPECDPAATRWLQAVARWAGGYS